MAIRRELNSGFVGFGLGWVGLGISCFPPTHTASVIDVTIHQREFLARAKGYKSCNPFGAPKPLPMLIPSD